LALFNLLFGEKGDPYQEGKMNVLGTVDLNEEDIFFEVSTSKKIWPQYFFLPKKFCRRMKIRTKEIFSEGK